MSQTVKFADWTHEVVVVVTPWVEAGSVLVLYTVEVVLIVVVVTFG